jgi:hypothetical protein
MAFPAFTFDYEYPSLGEFFAHLYHYAIFCFGARFFFLPPTRFSRHIQLSSLGTGSSRVVMEHYRSLYI